MDKRIPACCIFDSGCFSSARWHSVPFKRKALLQYDLSVGTLLGLLSKISLFRIKFDTEQMLPDAGDVQLSANLHALIFLITMLMLSRCVDCFNCISICPDKALSYGPVRFKKTEHETDESKRKFIAGSS